MPHALPDGPAAVGLPARRLAQMLVLALTLGMGACSFAPEALAPEPVEALPDAYEQADTLGTPRQLAWWRTYDDPMLARVVDAALEDNLDLREALARVAQARAQYRAEFAGLLPDVQGSASYQYQAQPGNTGIGGQLGGGASGGQDGGQAGGGGQQSGGQPDTTGGGTSSGQQQAAAGRFSYGTYSAALSFSYELDFWGRIRNSINAADEQYAASVADLRTARLQVIAQTMRTYFQLVALEQRLDLTREQLDLLEQRLELTELRYRRGLVTTFELYTIRQQYRQAQSSLPQLESQLYSAEAQLAVLLGGYPGFIDDLLAEADTLEVGLELDPIPAGLPSTLLEERPDVLAAFRRMEAARYQVGVARAARFPQFALTGQAGTQSSELVDLVNTEQWYVSFAANLTAPIFSGGRIRANIDAAEAAYVQQASAYAQTVLTAFQEVETALKDYDETRTRYRFLLDQLENARSSARLQFERYREGVADYLDYLDARRSLVDVQTALVETERALAEARLAVHRALGGAWVEYDVEETIDDVLDESEML